MRQKNTKVTFVWASWDLHSQSQQKLLRVSKLAQDVAQFWFWASLDLGGGEIGWQESPDFSVVCINPLLLSELFSKLDGQ